MTQFCSNFARTTQGQGGTDSKTPREKTAVTKMKLIVMTKPSFFVEEDKILATLFEEGMESLHLNKPGSEPVYSERLLTLLPDDYYRHITVHNHFYLKEEYGLRGIHLDNVGMELPYGYKGRVSCTCTNAEEVRLARKRADYVFLQTGMGGGDAAALRKIVAQDPSVANRHVYALGGVNADNIRMMRDMGFGGVVVCSDLWDRFNIQQGTDYKDLIVHFLKLQKAAS